MRNRLLSRVASLWVLANRMGANRLELETRLQEEICGAAARATRVGSSKSFHADLRSGPAALLNMLAAAIALRDRSCNDRSGEESGIESVSIEHALKRKMEADA